MNWRKTVVSVSLAKIAKILIGSLIIIAALNVSPLALAGPKEDARVKFYDLKQEIQAINEIYQEKQKEYDTIWQKYKKSTDHKEKISLSEKMDALEPKLKELADKINKDTVEAEKAWKEFKGEVEKEVGKK
jgi:predicted nuclease with TOPRIM domain